MRRFATLTQGDVTPPDDEVTVNSVLDGLGLDLTTEPDGREATSGVTPNGLQVDLLTSHQVHRGFANGRTLTLPEAQDASVLVYHAPDFVKSASGATIPLWVPRKVFDNYDEHVLREAGMWTLRDDWRTVGAHDGSLRGWISAITAEPRGGY